LGQNIDKKIVLVGDNGEVLRVYNLLISSGLKVNIAGVVVVKDASFEYIPELYLGNIDRIDEIVEIYDINELIFCSKDLPANQIIELMTRLDSTKIDYKIVPDESNYVIGSNSKNKAGDLYTVDVQLQLLNKTSIRNKRFLDICVSLFFIITFPLLIFMVKNIAGFVANIFSVLIGSKTWVGLKFHDKRVSKNVKNGIINPSSHLSNDILDEVTAKRLDLIYAKEYETNIDINLITRSIALLGN
jgi:hypothetical protein